MNRARRPLAVLAVASALTLAACDAQDPAETAEPEANTIEGSISVLDDDVIPDSLADSLTLPEMREETDRILSERAGEPCTGASISPGYGDIGPGADVVVRDEGGDIIATGKLDEGTWAEDQPLCVLPLAAEDVPVAKFYSVEVGQRGEMRYSHDEMEQADFTVELSIG